MNKTKIEWCDSTWNPVTGCMHGCVYCYARQMANRFKGYDKITLPDTSISKGQHVLEVPAAKRGKVAPYPFNFDPTFHRYHLDEPQKWKNPRTIFVCSMTDLFGDWVPDEWIEAVFEACGKAPQHRYLFLTKNPKRYIELADNGKLPQNKNMWYGISITNYKLPYCQSLADNLTISAQKICQQLLTRLQQWLNQSIQTKTQKINYVPKSFLNLIQIKETTGLFCLGMIDTYYCSALSRKTAKGARCLGWA